MSEIESAQFPNILFIMADQLRQDALGVYGSWAPTPHLDELATESVVFDNAVTTSPVCKPARFSLALGQYPHNFGMWANAPGRIVAGTPTWMNSLRTAGYRTSVFGKLHFGGKDHDLRNDEKRLRTLGFEVVNEIHGPRGCLQTESHMTEAWREAGVLEDFRADLADRINNHMFVARPSPLPLDLYYDSWVPSRAVEHIESLPPASPWFCMVSFGGPHEPWDAPEPYASMFDPRDAPEPIPATSVDGDHPPSSLDRQIRFASGMAAEDVSRMRANYAGSVALIDDQVGRLLDAVKRRGEWGNTIVAFTSDHGEMNGDHGLFYKNNFLEGAVEIPFIVRDPRNPMGRRSQAPAELHDIGATVLDLAGVEPGHETFAHPQLDLDRPPRPVALSEFLGEYMVYDGRHKLVVNADGDTAILFDKHDDPGETTNLVGDPGCADLIAGLRDQLLRTLVSSQLGHRKQGSPGGVRAQQAIAEKILGDLASEPR